MLPTSLVHEIDRLLKAGQLSHRKIATRLGVSRGTIMAIARDRGLERVDQVTRATRACSGCGSCAPAVEALLGELKEGRELELSSARAGAEKRA